MVWECMQKGILHVKKWLAIACHDFHLLECGKMCDM